MEKWTTIIAHVDLDAFFAAVEELMHPEWKGKPVIVGADPAGGKGRGVVSTANYIARKYGVHSAMPISQAYRLCPQGVYVYPHGKVYQNYSEQVFAIFGEFSPIVEPLSIDEAFLDLTGTLHLHGSAEKMGEAIRTRIFEKTRLTASVGIAPCKSVAKIASEFRKPNGLTVVYPSQIETFLDPLPISNLWGIGPKMQQTLKKMGIHTVFQLRQYPLDILESKFGKMGAHIYRMARGEDAREVHRERDAKSVSNEITFETDQTDWNRISDTVFALSEKVSGRLRRSGIRGRTLHLKIRFEDFKTFTRSYTMKQPTNLTRELYETTRVLLQEFAGWDRPVRLLGVGVSNLVQENQLQMSLWEENDEKTRNLEKVMDKIQDKYGKDAIMHAQSLGPAKKSKKSKDTSSH